MGIKILYRGQRMNKHKTSQNFVQRFLKNQAKLNLETNEKIKATTLTSQHIKKTQKHTTQPTHK